MGIAIGTDKVAVSFYNGWGKKIQTAQAPHQMPIRDGNLDGLADVIGPLIDTFPAQVRRADTLVHVALPDPMFQQAALRFDAFPKTVTEARALVQWRMCSELQLDGAQTAAGYHVTVHGRDVQTLVLAQTVPQAVVDTVTRQLWAVGLVPTAIDAMSSYLCPPPSKKDRPSGRAGAIYWQGVGWWCLRPIDAQGIPQPHFAAWLDADGRQRPSEQVLRRLKRVLGSVEDAAYLNTVSYGLEAEALTPIAQLGQDLSLDQSTQQLGSWTSAATFVAGKDGARMSVCPAPRNYPAYIALAFYLGCALLVGTLWFKTADYWDLRTQTQQIIQDSARVSAQLTKEQALLDQAPALAEIEALRQRVNWYNGQISNGASPLIDHLDLLEKSLPDPVRLSALFYDRQGRYLTLSLMSDDEDALRDAYAKLSKTYAATFDAKVDLERQVTLDSSGERLFQFDARISE